MSELRAFERLAILRAMVAAHDRIGEVLATVAGATSDLDAVERVAQLLGCDPKSALAVCSASVVRLGSRESQARLSDELGALERHLSL